MAELDLDGIITDIQAHSAELPADVVDCVGCHIAVTDVPALVAEVRRLRAELAEVNGRCDQTAAARDRYKRERDAERVTAGQLRQDLREADDSNGFLQQHIAEIRAGEF